MSFLCPTERMVLPVLAAAWLLLCAGDAAGGAGGVEGRLVRGTEPVPGGRVAAFASADFSQGPASLSSPSAADGRYSLDLPPGSYYLAATAGALWAYCGQNPVVVTDADTRTWIGFNMSPWPEPVVRTVEEMELDARLSGVALLEGEPQEDVTISLYLDDEDGFRGLGFLRSSPTGPDGRFLIDMVPSGRYFLLARRRVSGLGVGPVVKGDLFAYYRYNPLTLAAGTATDVVLPLVAKRQEKDVRGVDLPEGRPAFEGTVRNREGEPAAGVHVFAYREPTMGHFKPAALSSVTDDRGSYRITLPEPGKYYIGARDGYGDSPSPGERFGHYEGTPDHSITLHEGQRLRSVDITVERVLVP
ncbi:MAG: carboxypeptidase regulatory-like domain-containing protein [bacterium]|nr:MAG: carboxypeptidase regulatory-like domain-containing protein [bacterium]